MERDSLGMWTAGQSRAWRGLLVESWGASGPGSWKASSRAGPVAATALKTMLTISEEPGEVG